ncbi:HAD-IIIA family hydrolase [Anabaena azotica]|uniref:HAD-IIIA family hydrolase n=1 Tax=Anabaena azotica FACHB-119 TaxID=947527 RepID=A0ABR8D9S1_9NOST|nr:HAD-IIIA family hydrolase [Anabaena azotica]MBD2503958.1 HAD-IIIA family hydrolase [Anabaena azotica FACHB-119]
MKRLTIVRGCPGDGKTTLSMNLYGTDAKRIAADDMPGLYDENGKYQSSLQKQSHEWCKKQVEQWMKQGEEEIIVHNTFTRLIYIKDYLRLCEENDYSVHIVHSEAVIMNNGERTKSTHNVPSSILESMRYGWEPFNKIPNKGISLSEIALQMENLEFPNVIVFDKDKTIHRPKDGRSFPERPDDFELTPEFERWAEQYDKDCLLYVVSNQRGISTGQKSIAFLDEEAMLLNKQISSLGLNFERMYFAPDRQSKNYLVYENDCRVEVVGNELADKPNVGTFEDIIFEARINLIKGKTYWIVGDSHTDNTSTDWEYYKNCKAKFPEVNLFYVPIEFLNLFWNKVK